jgi:hypothetical protein
MHKKQRPEFDFDDATKFIVKRFKHPSADRSFLREQYNDPVQWSNETRKWLKEILLFNPPEVPPEIKVTEETKFDGYTQKKIYFMAAENCKVSACLLLPDKYTSEKMPAIVALHDHSGQY